MDSIFNARTNILKYYNNLGYNTDSYNNFSLVELNSMLESGNLDFKLDKEVKVYIKFHTEKALRVQFIEEMIDDLFNIENELTEKDHIVLIAKDSINDTIKQYLCKLFADRNVFIIHYSLKELQFNILDHKLVPKHICLSDEESDEFRKKYNITNNDQIPEISRFDPAAKAIALMPNKIVKIKRESKNSITSDYFRICMNK